MIRETKQISEKYALKLVRDLNFSPVKLPRLPAESPLIYVLPENVRKVHPSSAIDLLPSIALVDNPAMIRQNDECYSIRCIGRFAYYGIDHNDDFIYLGGGNFLSEEGKGRIFLVNNPNCFTSSVKDLEEKMSHYSRELPEIILKENSSRLRVSA